MTVLNAWVSAGEATLACDSIAAVVDGSARAVSKINVLPHICAALGARGNDYFATALFGLIAPAGFTSFDQMLDGMPKLIGTAEGFGFQNWSTAGKRGYELLAVGWSDFRNRMLGRIYRKREGDAETLATDVDDASWITPWHASMEGTSTDLANAEELVGVQARWLGQFGASGGHVVLCRLTKNAVMVTRKKLRAPLTVLPERAPDLGKATER
jgi:hypothetical protein